MEKVISVGFPLPKKEYYKVYVRSITFNQASYIEDCLNGVAMQQTDFPFVHHVIDDCSTDGEQEVIKTYLNNNCDMDNAEYYDNDICSITIAKNKSNPHCTLVVYFLKENMYGNPEKQKLFEAWREVCTYEALCEGDDYWTSPLKLSKQVQIMDLDNKIIMVHSGFICVDENGVEIIRAKYERMQSISAKERGLVSLWAKNHIITASTLFRRELFESDFIKNLSLRYDYAYFFSACFLGKIRYINEKTCAYRKNQGSLMNSNRCCVNSDLYKIYKYFVNHYFNRENKESIVVRIESVFYILSTIVCYHDFVFLRSILKKSNISKFILPIAWIMGMAKWYKNRNQIEL